MNIYNFLTVDERLELAKQGRCINKLIHDPDRRVRDEALEHDLNILIDDHPLFEDNISE
ncbi:hypothetical protein [Photobacterium leiognathi]|uniref:Uncharacterized protein n=1 Tax=Photobacterium leiognathi lrivu.4.1 TaxID=1248232 RepID=V5H6N0_PHOLE|nr:hypothetical protein [Photobacterium leiognathi]GAD32647.1 conserved hypothetical protein [Photobacterium leiognathi lrivu.4.1]